MALAHVFIETNFLFSIFRLPSKRRHEALALQARFERGEVKFYLPYLCLQEARHLIGKSLPNQRWPDLLEFQRHATEQGSLTWDVEEVKKLLNAAAGEVSRTKAVYQRELAAFAAALGPGLLHGTQEVFDCLEALALDDDTLKYNDKLILSSVLVKARELRQAGEQRLFFASIDKSDLQPTAARPKLTRCYQEAGVVFVPGFTLPDEPPPRGELPPPTNGASMLYLDNAATSYPKPESVYQALDSFARQSLANPGRAGHKMALAAEHALDDCRHLLNQLFHGKEPERFVFTLNATDALNMAFKGVLADGDHVLTTDLEHNSVSRPLRALELAGRISLTRIHADGGGTVNPDDVRRAVTPRTRLIALTHASNVLGTVQPVAEIGRIAREHDLFFLVDAAQTAGVLPIDVQELHIDLLAFPGHKSLLGPTGTGALYVGPRARLRPWREGGTGGDSASETQPREFPYYLEGGTPNVLGVAGLAAGIRYVQEQGLERIHAHEAELVERLWRRLDDMPGHTVFGHRDGARRVGTLSFRSEALAAAELGGILDEAFDIAVRPGLHCAPYIHRSLGTFPEGTVRVSPGPFNTPEDIDRLAEALAEIAL